MLELIDRVVHQLEGQCFQAPVVYMLKCPSGPVATCSQWAAYDCVCVCVCVWMTESWLVRVEEFLFGFKSPFIESLQDARTNSLFHLPQDDNINKQQQQGQQTKREWKSSKVLYK